MHRLKVGRRFRQSAKSRPLFHFASSLLPKMISLLTLSSSLLSLSLSLSLRTTALMYLPRLQPSSPSPLGRPLALSPSMALVTRKLDYAAFVLCGITLTRTPSNSPSRFVIRTIHLDLNHMVLSFTNSLRTGLSTLRTGLPALLHHLEEWN